MLCLRYTGLLALLAGCSEAACSVTLPYLPNSNCSWLSLVNEDGSPWCPLNEYILYQGNSFRGAMTVTAQSGIQE